MAQSAFSFQLDQHLFKHNTDNLNITQIHTTMVCIYTCKIHIYLPSCTKLPYNDTLFMKKPVPDKTGPSSPSRPCHINYNKRNHEIFNKFTNITN